MHEDLRGVRDPNSARVLATVWRIVLSLANAAVDVARRANPKTKEFQQRFRARNGGQNRLAALVFAKQPDALNLEA